MSFKLTQRIYLKKLVKCTYATWRYNKSVGFFFHNLLSFTHGFGINKLGAIFKKHTVN